MLMRYLQIFLLSFVLVSSANAGESNIIKIAAYRVRSFLQSEILKEKFVDFYLISKQKGELRCKKIIGSIKVTEVWKKDDKLESFTVEPIERIEAARIKVLLGSNLYVELSSSEDVCTSLIKYEKLKPKNKGSGIKFRK